MDEMKTLLEQCDKDIDALLFETTHSFIRSDDHGIVTTDEGYDNIRNVLGKLKDRIKDIREASGIHPRDLFDADEMAKNSLVSCSHEVRNAIRAWKRYKEEGGRPMDLWFIRTMMYHVIDTVRGVLREDDMEAQKNQEQKIILDVLTQGMIAADSIVGRLDGVVYGGSTPEDDIETIGRDLETIGKEMGKTIDAYHSKEVQDVGESACPA